MKTNKSKIEEPTASDKVLDATSHIFAQGSKRTASPVTENAQEAFRETIKTFDSLDDNELAVVLLMHITILGRRLNENTKRT